MCWMMSTKRVKTSSSKMRMVPGVVKMMSIRLIGGAVRLPRLEAAMAKLVGLEVREGVSMILNMTTEELIALEATSAEAVYTTCTHSTEHLFPCSEAPAR